jgi:hypothetical protein
VDGTRAGSGGKKILRRGGGAGEGQNFGEGLRVGKRKRGVANREERQPLSQNISPSPNRKIRRAPQISIFGEGDQGGEVRMPKQPK